MWFPTAGVKVYLGLGATDMRKSIDSLSIMVSEHLNGDPFSGHMFVFCNRRRTILKILYWDRNGFCLWHKRLEHDRFRWPEAERLKKVQAKKYPTALCDLYRLTTGLSVAAPWAGFMDIFLPIPHVPHADCIYFDNKL